MNPEDFERLENQTVSDVFVDTYDRGVVIALKFDSGDGVQYISTTGELSIGHYVDNDGDAA